MDRNSGPFRSGRPAVRPVSAPAPASAPQQPTVEPGYREIEEKQPVHEVTPDVSPKRERAPRVKNAKKRILVRIGVILVIIILVAVVTCFAWQGVESLQTGINTKEYQAVALTNNEIYVGKLKRLNDQYMVLSDVFYLQSNNSSNSSDSTTLTKPSSGIYGSEDQMIIPRAQISFYENLQPSGKVAQAIAKYDAAN